MAGEAAGPPAGAPVRSAWAKVNLYLHVLGRRPDGYHELDSLVVFLGIGDRLTLETAAALSLEVSGPFAAGVPGDESNLVLRAARRLAEACGVAPAARIRLHKNLPAAAGIGGGSADAAAALDGLSALWGVSLGAGETLAIARDLGADVPICLYGRPAFMGGVGELIERAPPLPPAWFALVNPGRPLETPRVFAAREGGFSRPARWHEAPRDVVALAERLEEAGNDLQAAAIGLAPEVGEALALLRDAPGCLLARMSGSGATCFGLFAARDEAAAAASAIAEAQPAWWAVAAPLLHGKLDRSWWDEPAA